MNHNHDLEREVIVTLIFGNLDTPEAARVTDEDFTLNEHRCLFSALKALNAAGESNPSFQSILGHSRKSGDMLDEGMLARILEGLESFSVGSFRSRILELRQLTMLRKLSEMRLIQSRDPTVWAGKVQTAVDAISALALTDSKSELTALETVVKAIFAPDTRIPTGIPSLDAIVAGMGRRELVILGARPSVGKSALAMTVALQVSDAGLPVDFYSFEMSRESLIGRAVSFLARRNLRDMINDRTLYSDELNRSAAYLDSLPIRIIEPPRDLAEFQRSALARQKSHATRLVIVDYLQLMDTRANTEYERITRVASGLKHLANRMDCPLIACAQINRGAGKECPAMTHLKGSGQIEQDADQIWLLHREQNDEGIATGANAKLIVAKNRDGATGSIALEFFAAQSRFAPPNWNPFET